MSIDYIPLAFFVLVTTFTPGPSNISSAVMGVMYGYQRTFRYLVGITAGFFFVMLLCAYISSALLEILPSLEPTLRILGSGYILWLAICTARASYGFGSDKKPPMSFRQGVWLQPLNPKAIIYGLTLYTTFLAPVADNHFFLLASSIFFSIATFCSTSLWALCGASIKKYLQLPGIRRWVNLFLVLLLVYCALNISGLHIRNLLF